MGDHISKYMDIIEASLSHGDVKSVFNKVRGNREKGGLKNKLLGRKEVTERDLFNAWKAKGYPNEADALKSILKSVGFSNGEIKRAYNQVGIDIEQGSDERIAKLGDIIDRLGISNHIIDYLEDDMGITESVQLSEKVIDDKQIAGVFKNLISQSAKQDKKTTQSDIDEIKPHIARFGEEMQNADFKVDIPQGETLDVDGTTYVRGPMMWMRKNPDTGKMSPAPKDAQKSLTQYFRQEVLIDEMVAYMNDRRGTPEFEELKGTVASLIRRYAPEFAVNDALSKLNGTQNESLTFDRNSIQLSNNNYMSESTLDTFFKQVIDLHTYGRRKRV